MFSFLFHVWDVFIWVRHRYLSPFTMRRNKNIFILLIISFYFHSLFCNQKLKLKLLWTFVPPNLKLEMAPLRCTGFRNAKFYSRTKPIVNFTNIGDNTGITVDRTTPAIFSVDTTWEDVVTLGVSGQIAPHYLTRVQIPRIKPFIV